MHLCLYILEKTVEERTTVDIKILALCTKTIKFFKELRMSENGDMIHEECCKFMYYKYFPADQVVF